MCVWGAVWGWALMASGREADCRRTGIPRWREEGGGPVSRTCTASFPWLLFFILIWGFVQYPFSLLLQLTKSWLWEVRRNANECVANLQMDIQACTTGGREKAPVLTHLRCTVLSCECVSPSSSWTVFLTTMLPPPWSQVSASIHHLDDSMACGRQSYAVLLSPKQS